MGPASAHFVATDSQHVTRRRDYLLSLSNLKSRWFRLRAVDPSAAVVSFWSGEETLATEMTASVRRQTPDRPHYIVSTTGAEFPGTSAIHLGPGDAWSLYRQLRSRLQRIHIALAPTLFTATPDPLRVAAVMYAPARVLGFNASLQRHHLRLTRPLQTWHFLSGGSFDQGAQRPAWVRTLRCDDPDFPDGVTVYEGRSLANGRPRIGIVTPYFPFPLAHGG